MPIVRMGKRGIVVLPAAVRRQVGINEGDELIVEADIYGGIHILKKPRDYAQYMRNLGKEVWQGIDPVEYVRKERESWEK